MELSVIIPVYREVPAVYHTLTRLLSLDIGTAFEVIVVDGEPAQTTLRYLKQKLAASPPSRPERIKLTTSERGRGLQMNAGAASASGQLFFFLHGDTWLAQQGMDQMMKAWQSRDSAYLCGAFDLTIDSTKPWFRTIERAASLRSRLTRIPYGDQGIFISRPLFEAVGGFPRVPLMEDVGLMAAVRQKGYRPCFLGPWIHTSARRWESRGVVQTTLMNWGLITLYAMGVPPRKLERIYYSSLFR